MAAPEPARARHVLAQPDFAPLAAHHEGLAARLGRALAVPSAPGQDLFELIEPAWIAERAGTSSAELGFGGDWPWLPGRAEDNWSSRPSH